VTGWAVTVDVHIWPLHDLIAHELHETCPCKPTAAVTDSDSGVRTFQFTHHSLDGRELSEVA
jgi:hypothetical protein